MKTIIIDGDSLTLEQISSLKNQDVNVKLSTKASSNMKKSYNAVGKILASGDVVYGINTGFGALSSKTIDKNDLNELQRNLIRSHACAVGERMKPEHVLMMMLIRVNSIAKGFSGARVELVELIIDMINNRIAPEVPRIGSLGASGDLAPLSHMALGIIGEGRSSVQSTEGNWIITDAKDALIAAGLQPTSLEAKEGLSLINGTSQMCTYLTESILNCEKLIFSADASVACSIESIKGSISPFDKRIHLVRPQIGQSISAARISGLLQNSKIMESHKNCGRVQDSYSFRCAPQVHGPMIDTIKESRRILEIEINSATDNPLIFVENSEIDVISAGNFHGQSLAIVSDTLAVNCHEIGSISERRTNQILDPDWSNQNAFLAQNEGLESGLMILQYVSAAVLAEMNLLANSVTTTNIPVSLGKEDHVSMGATGSYRLLQQTKFLSLILANEFICSSVALDNITETPSDSVSKIHAWIRETVPPLMGDRAFSIETENLAAKILGGFLCNIFEE